MAIPSCGRTCLVLLFPGLAATASVARGVETFTPPIRSTEGNRLDCLVQNLGEVPVMVQAVLRSTTALLESALEVAPGETVALISTTTERLNAYCRFEMDADPATVRGFIALNHVPGGDPLLLAPATAVEDTASAPTQTVTPPVRVLSENVVCQAQNVGDAPVQVTAELVDEDGDVLASQTNGISAGGVVLLINTALDVLNGYCRFTFEGSPDAVRGWLATHDTGIGSDTHLLLPARPVAAAGSAAHYTPPVLSPAGDATTCIAQNLGPAMVQASAQLIDTSGAVLGDGDAMLAPGEVRQLTGTTEAVDNGICRIVFADPSALARGFVSRFPMFLFSNTTLVAPAAPATGVPGDEVTAYAPPVTTTDTFVQCPLVNLTDDPVPVHVAIEDGDGMLVTMADALAPAGRAQNLSSTAADLEDGFCRFTFEGSPDVVRGYATVTDTTGFRTRLVLPAAPIAPPPTATATATRTATPTATPNPTSSSTATASASPTATAPPTATRTATPTVTRTANPTSSSTVTATAQPTATAPPPATETPSTAPSATATALPSATSTVPSAAPTVTATVDPPVTATATVDALATATATAGPACTGDCNGDGQVTIDELVTLVHIALGAPLAACPAGDRNDDGAISIDELVAAVANALGACPGTLP